MSSASIHIWSWDFQENRRKKFFLDINSGMRYNMEPAETGQSESYPWSWRVHVPTMQCRLVSAACYRTGSPDGVCCVPQFASPHRPGWDRMTPDLTVSVSHSTKDAYVCETLTGCKVYFLKRNKLGFQLTCFSSSRGPQSIFCFSSRSGIWLYSSLKVAQFFAQRSCRFFTLKNKPGGAFPLAKIWKLRAEMWRISV